MTITLKLDASAVHALFPPGSEAHLELSRSIVAEVLRKSFKSDMTVDVQNAISKATNALRSEIEATHTRLINAEFERKWPGFSVKEKSELTAAIRQRAGEEYTATIRRITGEEFDRRANDSALPERIAGLVNTAMSAFESSQIKLRINEAVEKFKALIK